MRSFFLLTIAFSLAFAKHIKNFHLGDKDSLEFEIIRPENGESSEMDTGSAMSGLRVRENEVFDKLKNFNLEDEDAMELELKRLVNGESPEMDTGSAMSGLKVRENEESQNLDTRSSYSNEYDWFYHHLFFDYSECVAHQYTSDYLYDYFKKKLPAGVEKALLVPFVKERIKELRDSLPEAQNCHDTCVCLTGSPGSCQKDSYFTYIPYVTTDKNGNETERKVWGIVTGFDCLCDKKFNPLEVMSEAFKNGEKVCKEKKPMNPVEEAAADAAAAAADAASAADDASSAADDAASAADDAKAAAKDAADAAKDAAAAAAAAAAASDDDNN